MANSRDSYAPLHSQSWKLDKAHPMNEKRENQLSRLYMQVRELSLIALIVIEIALIGVFTHLPSPWDHKLYWDEHQF